MSTRNRTIAENLERLELAKLKQKYEALGYEFTIESRRQHLSLDAYAYRKEPRDEIIFEVKAIATLSAAEQRQIISERRKIIKQAFPNARFVLVIAKENEESEVVDSPTLNTLLASYISERQFEILRGKIPDIERPLSVEKVSIDKVEFGDFSTIKMAGYANLLFYLRVDTVEFQGIRLADGITFKFEVSLQHTNNPQQIYNVAPDSRLYFDFAEFEPAG